MAHILQLKYPAYNAKKEIWLSAISISVLVYLFLVVFQPFGTYNYVHENKYILLAPYAAIAFIAFLSGDLIVSGYFQKWTWKKEILKNSILLCICSLLNYGYSLLCVNDDHFSLRALLYMAIFTFSLGFPVCTIYILGRYSFLRSRIRETAAVAEPEPVATSASLITITPDAGEAITLVKSDFLFARSEGNYTTIYYVQNESVRKQLVRISLKKLEDQIGGQYILRCHRSYMVNIQQATGKKGNAQGYKIAISCIPETVPVSRKYIVAVLNCIP